MSYALVQQLGLVRTEYDAARAAVAYVERVWHTLVDVPETQGVRLAHVRLSKRNLEDTYIIRLFAQFEGLLQQHFSISYPRRRIPRTTEALINRIALLRRVPNPIREDAHAVREYRNSVVHPGAPRARPFSFPQALAALNRFLAALPDTS